jgi:hypothetical protein
MTAPRVRPESRCVSRFLLLGCCLSFTPPPFAAQPDDTNLRRSSNAIAGWERGPGWIAIAFNHPGRSRRDSAMTVKSMSDGTLVVGGLVGRDSAAHDNGLLGAVSLTSGDEPSMNWTSTEDLRNGTLPGSITWPYLYDFLTETPVGEYDVYEGVGFAGSGRVGTDGPVNQAKFFSVRSGGATVNGGLRTCQLLENGTPRDFFAQGAFFRAYNTAEVAGYIRRGADGAQLFASCDLPATGQGTRRIGWIPPGAIGTVAVFPHYVSPPAYVTTSYRVIRNVDGSSSSDVVLCRPAPNLAAYPLVYDNCSAFAPNVGGHLSDRLHSVVPTYMTGLIESQAESSPGPGSDRTVLTIARPAFYMQNADGSSISRPAQQKTFLFGDAAFPPNTLSFHSPIGLYDNTTAGSFLWVVMALRRFPDVDEFREIAVARMNFETLELDTSFGGGTGWRRFSLGGAEVMPNAVTIDASGRLVIVGSRRMSPDDDWDFFVMRMIDDALFKNGFGS